MKPSRISAALGPALFLFASACGATSHAKAHQNALKPRHSHGHTHAVRSAGYAIPAGKKTCKFPADDPDLVAVTPESLNAGWAMSPDRECLAGQYCPYACKSGKLMAQWEPDSNYTYPSSMNGGLHCGDDGVARKPFPDQPYCAEGTGAVKIVNQCRKPLSWCQTVLPGSELMAIPTLAEVKVETTISVPGSDYWCETSAHYYVNPPGTGAESCIWGTESQPIGNWSPYVAGFNTVSDGRTFVKIGWNPKYLELDMGAPDYSLKIECPDGGCNGLPCEIHSSSGKGSVQSHLAATGAGGADFCVVTVAKDKTAIVVVNDEDSDRNSSSSISPGHVDKAEHEHENEALRPYMMAEEAAVVPESTPKPASQPTTSETSTTQPLTVQTSPPPPPETTSSPAPVSSTPAQPSAPLSKSVAATNSSMATSATNATTSKPSVSTMSRHTRPPERPGAVFHENATAPSGHAPHGSVSSSWSPPQSTPANAPASPAAAPPRAAEAGRQQGNGAVAGLVVALVAAACLF